MKHLSGTYSIYDGFYFLNQESFDRAKEEITIHRWFTPRNKDIVQSLLDGMSAIRVARKFNLSYERVRQIFGKTSMVVKFYLRGNEDS